MSDENKEEEVVTDGDLEDNDSPLSVLGEEAFEDVELSEADDNDEDSTPTGDGQAVEGDDDATPPVEGGEEGDGDGSEGAVADSSDQLELVDYTVKHGDAEFDIKVTPEQAKALDAQKQSALQFPHIQQKYTELKQQTDRAAQMAQSTTPVQGQQTGQPLPFEPEEFVKRMEPAVNDAVERGAISADFSNAFPMEAANYAWAAIQLSQISETLTPLVQRHNAQVVEGQRDSIRTKVYEGMENLASSNPDLYSDLTDKKTRDEFFDHLCEINADMNFLFNDMGKALSQFWGSYQGPKLAEAARAAQERLAKEQAEKRLLSGGAGGGGGSRPNPSPDNLADIHSILGGGGS
jgi:hypothetical protein